MVLSNFWLTDDILNLQLIYALGGLRSSLVVQSDPENRAIAVGISLLTCIEAEIRVMFLLPGNGRDI